MNYYGKFAALKKLQGISMNNVQWMRTGISSLSWLFVLLCLFNISGPTPASNFYGEGRPENGIHSKAVISQDYGNSLDPLSHLALEIDETEFSNQDEVKEPSSVSDFFNNNSKVDPILATTLVKKILSVLTFQIKNRSEVSLFILHHCWKSFLS